MAHRDAALMLDEMPSAKADQLELSLAHFHDNPHYAMVAELPPLSVADVMSAMLQDVALIEKLMREAILAGDLSTRAIRITYQMSELQRIKCPLHPSVYVPMVRMVYYMITETEFPVLNKLELLVTVSPFIKRARKANFQLPWGPLCEEMSKYHFTKFRRLLTAAQREYAHELVNYARAMRRFFPASAGIEIMDTYRPLLCPYDQSLFKAQSFICTLMPTHAVTSQVLEELILVWKTMDSSFSWDGIFLHFTARVLQRQKGIIDWSAHYVFLFTKFLQNLTSHELLMRRTDDVMDRFDNTYDSFADVDSIKSIAKAIVCIIDDSPQVFDQFRTLINHLDPYFHPSTQSNANRQLDQLLYYLCQLFNERFLKGCHSAGKETTPPLSDETCTQYVDVMLSLCMQALYCDSSSMQKSAALSLGMLAGVQPTTVINKVLEKVSNDLQTLNESQRMYGVISALQWIARPMFNPHTYPNAPDALMSILPILLPAIDNNDLKKTIMAFSFLLSMTSSIPMVSPQDVQCSQKELEDYKSIIAKNTPGARVIDPTSETGQDIHQKMLSLQEFFLELSLQLLDQIISFLVSAEAAGGTSAISSKLLMFVQEFLHTFFWQLSPSAYQACLQKIANFLGSSTISLTPKLFSSLIYSAISVNPHLAFPKIATQFMSAIEGHVAKGNLSESEVVWNMKMLAWCCFRGRDEVVAISSRLLPIIEKLLHDKSPKVVKAVAKLVRYYCVALSSSHVVDLHSIPASLRQSNAYKKYPWMSWSLLLRHDQVEPVWHSPNHSHRSVVQSMFEKIVSPRVLYLQQYINMKPRVEGETYTKDQFRNALWVVRSFLVGAAELLPEWPSDLPEDIASVLDSSILEFSNARPYIANVSIRALQQQPSLFPDDAAIYLLLIKIAKSACRIMIMKKNPGDENTSILTSLSMKEVGGGLKLKSRRAHCFKSRINLYYWRHRKQLSLAPDVLNKELLQLFISASLQRLDKPRSRAHELVFIFSVTCDWAFQEYFSRLIGRICDTEAHEEEIASALRIMRYEVSLRKMFIDWTSLNTFVKALISTSSNDNMSKNQMLIEHVFLEFSGSFTTPPTKHVVVDKLPGYLQGDVELPEKSLQDDMLRKNASRLVESRQELESLIQTLTTALADPRISWKYQHACCLLMGQLPSQHSLPDEAMVSMLKAATNSVLDIREAGITAACSIAESRKNRQSREMVNTGSFALSSDYVYPFQMNQQIYYSTHFQDKNCHCWYQSEQSCVKYLYTPDQRIEISMDDTVLELLRSPEFYEKLYVCHESEHREEAEEGFMQHSAQLFKGLFGLYHDSFLDAIQPFITRLCNARDAAFCQSLAAEIIGGLVRGSKHWSFDKIEKLAEYMKPLLADIVANSKIEHRHIWAEAFRFIVYDRDPRRLWWFIDLALDFDLGTNTTNVESRKLLLVTETMSEFSWRSRPICDVVMDRISIHTSHPSKQIRREISYLLSLLLKNYNPPRAQTKSDVGGITRIGQYITESCQHILDTVGLASDDPNYDDALRKRSTFLQFICNSLLDLDTSSLRPYLGEIMYPMFIGLSDENKDCRKLCKVALVSLSKPAFGVISIAEQAMLSIERASSHENWRVRLATVAFAGLVLLHELFFLSKDQFVRLSEFICQKLCDEQVEVRNKASRIIADYARTCNDDYIQDMIARFKTMAQTPIRKRKASEALAQEQQTTSAANGEQAGRSSASPLAVRHGGILGLIGIVQGYPFSIPEWMPDVLVTVASHARDPSPIQVSVTQSISEFWMTHQNSWQEDQHRFTEDQLQLLQQQIGSQSYYA